MPHTAGMKKGTSSAKQKKAVMEDDLPKDITIDSLLDDEDLQNELYALGWKDHHSEQQSSKKSTSSVMSSVKSNPKKPESQPIDPFAMLETSPIDLHAVSSIGMIDESQLSLNEEDLQDPELLSMYQDLRGSDDDEEVQDNDHPRPQSQHFQQVDHYHGKEPTASHPTSVSHSVASNPIVQAPKQSSIPQSASASVPSFSEEDVIAANHEILSSSQLTAEEATKRALQYRRDGDTTEALKWFRLAKQLEGAATKPASSSSSAATSVPSKTSSSVLPPQPPPKPMKPNTTSTTSSNPTSTASSGLPSFLLGKSSPAVTPYSSSSSSTSTSSGVVGNNPAASVPSKLNPKSISDKG
jgi:hypothetical protein